MEHYPPTLNVQPTQKLNRAVCVTGRGRPGTEANIIQYVMYRLVQMYIGKCSLFRVSFIRVSTVQWYISGFGTKGDANEI